MQPPAKAAAAVAAAVAVAAALLVFGPTLRHGFVSWDDDINVYENPFLPGAGGGDLGRFWRAPYANLYVPVTYTAWFLTARAARSTDPTSGRTSLDARPFHVLNVSLHALNALLVFLLLLACLAQPAAGGDGAAPAPWRAAAAGAGAVLFAVHPLQAEPVSWVTGLKDVLSGTLGLAALLAFLHAVTRQRTSRFLYAVASALFVLALLAKPAAAMAPLAACVLALGVAGVAPRRAARAALPWLLLAGAALLATRLAQPPARGFEPPTPALRPLVALDAIAFYLAKLAVPADLCPNYGRTPEFVIGHGWAWVSWLLPAALVALAWPRASRLGRAGALFALCWLLPVLGLVPFAHQRYSTVADRYLYVALAGVGLALAGELLRARRRPAALAATAALLLLFGAVCRGQTRHWADPLSLHRHVVAVNPRASASYDSLANLYERRGNAVRAARYYRLAMAADPRNARARNNLGNLLFRAGRLDEAEALYREALAIGRDTVNALNNLGVVALRRERIGKAEALFQKALAEAPDFAPAHYNLGLVAEARGNPAAAAAHYERAVALRPDYPEANRRLAAILVDRHEEERALALLARAEGVAPRSARAYGLLAALLAARGQVARSLYWYREAAARGPRHPALLHHGWGKALLQLGRCEEAIRQFEKALALNPGLLRSWLARAACLHRLGRTEEAVAGLEAAQRRFPDSPLLRNDLAVYRRALAARATNDATGS